MATAQTWRARARWRPDEGASLVEFALVLPLLSILLFGMITSGLTLTRQNSVENAVREATRFGAVNGLGDPVDVDGYLRQVVEQAEVGATDDLEDGVPDKEICAAFVDDDGDIRRLTVDEAGNENFDDGTLCFTDNRSDRRVQVRAARTSEIDAVFFSRSVLLDSQSVTRYER